MAKEEQTEPIYETRDEKMVSPVDGKCTVRIARFLKPCSKHVNQAVSIPKTPLLCEVFPHNLQQWPSKVSFKGWNWPQKRWKEWVDKLAGKYSSIWIQTGICDAIMSSIYEIRCNQDLVLGLSEFWCSDTNTFVFPWGEATVTLEDIMILGGYPVLGEPLSSPLTDELVKIQEEMDKHRIKMGRSKAKKALQSGWLKHFMETEGEFEHAAFLSLWLSRYVLPPLAEETIGKHVFPIAAKLSQGIQVALAQAVLATLYQNLRILREKAISAAETISISGPFQLVQTWAFERFQLVGPKSPDSVKPGEPRVARWHKLSSKLNLPLVRSALRLAVNFLWRPYANTNLKNWHHPSYYKENERLIIDCSSSEDHELRSFLRCLEGCELVGIDCKEKYLPHRVAMQFGMDQDLPAEVSNFAFRNEFVNLFVPSRSFQPCVSMRYSNWWKDMMVAREGAIKDVLLSEASSAVQESVNKKDCHDPIASKNSNDPTALSQTSTKSSSDGNPPLVFPKIPSSTIKKQVVNASGATTRRKIPLVDSNVSVQSKTPKNSKKSNEVSKKSSIEETHKPIFPLYQVLSDDDDVPIARCILKSSYQDSSDDNVPIGRRMRKLCSEDSSDDNVPIGRRMQKSCHGSQNVAASTSSAARGSSRKRKLSTSKEEILPKEVTIQPVSSSARKASKFANNTNVFAREVKMEAECSVNEQLDTAEEGEGKMAGESLNNPIDLEGLDLEGRVRKLEKMMGVIQD